MDQINIIQQIEDALIKYHLTFFRNQHLTRKTTSSFARLFGDLYKRRFYSDVHDIAELIVLEFCRDRKTSNENCHIDETLPLSCVLCVGVVDDIIWSNIYSSYHLLSSTIKLFKSILSDEHFYTKHFYFTNIHVLHIRQNI